jgi:hypothetical protein
VLWNQHRVWRRVSLQETIVASGTSILGMGEPMHEKDNVSKAEHHGDGDAGCLIAATSNKASDAAEAARPDSSLQVQNNASIFLHWRSID